MEKRPILIIGDDKAGHVNQSKALCLNLGRPYQVATVGYRTPLHKMIAYLADRCFLRLPSLYRWRTPPPPQPFAAVVCAGSTAFYPGKITAHRLGVPVAALLDPKGWRRNFDAILAPAFDRPAARHNVIALPVNLTATTPEYFAHGVTAFRQRHTPTKPAIGLIVGGPNPVAQMTTDFMRPQLERIFAATEPCERWVTTSRRTPPAIDALLDTFPFDYKLIYARDQFNPIPAFVELCQTLFVTADSTGMLSEAVTSGRAAIEIIDNIAKRHSKFALFTQQLQDLGAAHIFDGTVAGTRKKIDLRPYMEKTAQLLKM